MAPSAGPPPAAGRAAAAAQERAARRGAARRRRRPAAAAAACLALLAPTLPGASAGNYSLTVTDDTRRVMDLGVFGFTNGWIHLDVEYLTMKNREDEVREDPIGFTLDWVTTAQFARQENNYGKGEEAQRKICFIQDPVVKPRDPPVGDAWRKVFALEDHLKEQKAKGLTFSHQVTEPGLYALFFYNCKGYSDKQIALQKRPVSFRVRVSQYNALPGGQRDYLSVGETKLPLMYFGFSVIFAFLAVSWVHAMRTNPEHVHKIHYLMVLLVVLKATSLFFEAAKFQYHKRNGVISAWDAMYYVFLGLKGIFLFLVILLLGTGWSFLKPVLSSNDKHVAMAILPLQVMINIAIAVVEETSEGTRSWAYWRDVLRVLDIVCCCCVLLPIVWSIKQIRASSGSTDGKVARNLARLKQFRTFYMAVVGFIYFTRIFVVILENSLTFRNTWIAPFVQEAAAVLFYLFTGLKFRPLEDNPYLYLEADDMEDDDLQEELLQRANMRPESHATGETSQVKAVKRGEDSGLRGPGV